MLYRALCLPRGLVQEGRTETARTHLTAHTVVDTSVTPALLWSNPERGRERTVLLWSNPERGREHCAVVV